MRILFTTPPMQHFNVSGVVFKNFGPYNIAKVAGNLPAHHQVRISDYTLRRFRPHTLADDIRRFRPDVVAISNPFSGYTEGVCAMARLAEELQPGVVTVAGGQAATYMWEHHLRGGFDFVVQNEGEVGFAELAAFLEGGGRPGDDAAHIDGLAYWRGDTPTHTARRKMVEDLDSLPWARRDLLPARRGLMSPGKAALAELARGCPFHCGFCSQPGMWGRQRRRDNAAVIDELQHLQDTGHTEVCFTDDTVGVDRGDAKAFPEDTAALLEGIASRGLKLRLGFCMRAETAAMHPEFVQVAARAGLRLVNMGFESYTRNGLAAVDKGENSLDINRRAAETLRRHGVLIWGSHIWGAPSQTDEDLAATVEYGPQYSDFFRMTMASPLPGSVLFKRLKKAGEVEDDTPLKVTYYKYLYRERSDRDPTTMQRNYIAHLSRYYLRPDSIGKMWDADPIKRELAQRSYRGAVFFGMHQALGLAGLSRL